MTLIRGLRGKKPCPKCLVPADQLVSHLLQTHEKRTSAKSQAIMVEAARMTAEAREKLLKDNGLRYVEVSPT